MSIFSNSYQYHMGFALSGGGAKGFAHLGALKTLKDFKIEPDIIAGTSAGALAGAFYADGFEPEEVIELFRKKEFLEFAEFTLPTKGFFKGTKLESFLKKNLRSHKFEQLQIPFIAVATDWKNMKYKCFSEGDKLIEAIIASCSFPIVFNPYEIDGIPYLDGGLLKNFPVSVIRDKCKYVIGLNLQIVPPMNEKINLKNITERLARLISFTNISHDRELCDVLIEVDGLEDFPMFSLDNIDLIKEIGSLATAEAISSRKYQNIIRRRLRYIELKEKIEKNINKIGIYIPNNE